MASGLCLHCCQRPTKRTLSVYGLIALVNTVDVTQKCSRKIGNSLENTKHEISL